MTTAPLDEIETKLKRLENARDTLIEAGLDEEHDAILALDLEINETAAHREEILAQSRA